MIPEIFDKNNPKLAPKQLKEIVILLEFANFRFKK